MSKSGLEKISQESSALVAQAGYCLKGRQSGFLYHPDRDFQISIAITIAIKILSGKIADRFSCSDRIPIFPEKSISDFLKKIGSRLKNRPRDPLTVVNRRNKFRQTCLTFHDRIPIFPEKSIPGFMVKIDQRFSNFNRDHDPDQKPFRKNR